MQLRCICGAPVCEVNLLSPPLSIGALAPRWPSPRTSPHFLFFFFVHLDWFSSHCKKYEVNVSESERKGMESMCVVVIIVDVF